MVPSICHTWYYTTLHGQHRRECRLFRDYKEPSLLLGIAIGPSEVQAFLLEVVVCLFI